jgi:hydroxymethylpyrimidine pyrophosphatase-like HAD family hydrolase
MIIAVDFDGTLFEDNFPYVGKPNLPLIEKLKGLKSRGVKLSLWTCRRGQALNNAIIAAADHGLHFDVINGNLGDTIMEYNGDSRKIFATYYLDDKAIRPDEFLGLDI